MPGKVYRTAIYCRLSREDGDKVESNSIASQRAICEDYIARHDDLEIVCEPFVDDGYSEAVFQHTLPQRVHDLLQFQLECGAVQFLRAPRPPGMPKLVAATPEVHADTADSAKALIFFGVLGIK